MRKVHQKKIQESLQILHSAHKQLGKEAQPENIAKLLAGCQELAGQMAGLISETEGQDTQTAIAIEDYTTFIGQADIGSIDKYFVKKLQTKLFKIDTLAQSELKPDKIEILFLPYKYSMADSLESIWLAAMKDPQCDVKICPIPYYDRLPSGTFGQMHYEGHCYPKDLPLVDWQTYDIEARRPDAIFIHNPYDDGNHVTSVHPNFYAKRLRGLTDMLVYVPYFVVMDDASDHFVTVPGCIYAHKVIVQSEKVRHTYVRVFKENFGNNIGRPEDKFLALGSPKFDKAINARRDGYELPEEWQELIGNKKAVFFNTTLGAMLYHNEQYLKKLRQVLDVFHDRDDVVLWWRPHPLSDATYKSMRPRLLHEYEQITADYKRGKWGIYDDSPDLHRAIACTDGYYGDRSSVVAMYEATRKPPLIAYPNIRPTASSTELLLENLCEADGRLWFTSINFNSFWAIDKDTWELEHIGFFPNEEAYNYRQFFSLITANDSIYCIPLSANNLIVYSPTNKIYNAIPIPIPTATSKISYDPQNKFIGGYKHGDYIFMTPSTYPGIVRYNTKTDEMSVFSDWILDLDSCLTSQHQSFIFTRGIVCGNKLYLACDSVNAVFEFDMDTNSHRIHKISNNNVGYLSLCFDGENFWLLPIDNGTVVKWNPKENVIQEFHNLCGTEFDVLYPFVNISYVDKCIWLLPHSGNRAVRIEVETGNISEIVKFQSEFEAMPSSQLYPGINFLSQECIGNSIYAYSAKSSHLFEYNTKTNNLRARAITLTPECFDSINCQLIRREAESVAPNRKRLHEFSMSLKYYLQLLTYKDRTKCAMPSAGTAGADIYNYISEATAP